MLSVAEALRTPQAAAQDSQAALRYLLLRSYCTALQRLLHARPHSLVGLQAPMIQRLARGASHPVAEVADQAGDAGSRARAVHAAAAGIVGRSASLAATVRAHVLQLDESSAMQVRARMGCWPSRVLLPREACRIVGSSICRACLEMVGVCWGSSTGLAIQAEVFRQLEATFMHARPVETGWQLCDDHMAPPHSVNCAKWWSQNGLNAASWLPWQGAITALHMFSAQAVEVCCPRHSIKAWRLAIPSRL